MQKKNKGVNYFKMFISGAEFACAASEKLNELVENQQSSLEIVQEVHAIENAADVQYRELVEVLSKAFITPIEREDIMRLAQSIDDMVDSIEDIAVRFYMFKINLLKPEAIEFIKLISEGCHAVRDTLAEFSNFKKSQKIAPLLVKVNDIEEKGDQLYRRAVRDLFDNVTDPLEIIKWRELFEIMEFCCDACEDVADVIESVMMKNS